MKYIFFTSSILVVALFLIIVICSILDSSGSRSKTSEKHVYILNTKQMNASHINWSDRTFSSIPLNLYLSEQTNTPSQNFPWADVYVCTVSNTISAHQDTLVILDTNCVKRSARGPLSNYWLQVENYPPLKQWKVNLTPAEFKEIKRYKYQYGKVTLVTDD